ncbi:MAG TPA: Mur ligase domain-containing protein [Myxococcota bacterium]
MPDPASAAVCDWIRQAAPGAALVSDSRKLKAGDVFFAYPGEAADGRRYIGAAIAAGAAAVVFDDTGFSWDDSWNVPHLAVPRLKQQAGPIAHAWYGQPDAEMYTVGVTGTNGKTSCSVWLGQAMARLGSPTVVIGTLGVGLFGHRGESGFLETGNTTPDAFLLAAEIARAAPIAVSGTLSALRAIDDSADDDVIAGFRAAALTSEDLVEGVSAANEKRPAKFAGR